MAKDETSRKEHLQLKQIELKRQQADLNRKLAEVERDLEALKS